MHNPKSSPRIFFRIYAFLRPYLRYVVAFYGLTIVTTGLALIIPQFIRWIIDTGITGKQQSILAPSLAMLIGLTLVKGIAFFFQGRWTEIASQGVAYDLRNAIHMRLTSLSFAYHDRTETGQHLSRSIQDVERIRFLTGRAVLRLVEGAVLFCGTLVLLFSMNTSLTLVICMGLPLLVFQSYQFGRLYRPLSLRLQNQLGVMTTRLEQNLRGAAVVKAFSQEPAEIARFDRENDLWFRIAARMARIHAFLPTLLAFMANLGTVVILWLGGRQIIHGTLSIGELVAFLTYLSQLMIPLRRFGFVIPAIAMGTASGERVLEILDQRSAVREHTHARNLKTIRGRVSFENVAFEYVADIPVLQDISFEVAPGEVVAFLGATGCGKSTIMNLLPRFYDVTAGKILLDEYDIRNLTLASLRRHIGIVLQETCRRSGELRMLKGVSGVSRTPPAGADYGDSYRLHVFFSLLILHHPVRTKQSSDGAHRPSGS